MIDLLAAKRSLTPMGNRYYGSGGKGGGGSTTYTQNVPKELMPYYSGMMDRAWQESNTPYQAYSQERLAGFTPMEQMAQQRAAGQQMPGQIGQASNLAASTGYGPSAEGRQGFNLMNYAAQTGATAGGPTAGGTYAQNQMLRQGQPTAQGQAGLTGIQGGMNASNTQRWTTPGVAASYMDPYMQNVVDIQKREAGRDFAQQSQNQRAQTGMRGGVGGIGGYRDQILQAEGNRNYQQQLGDIQQKGLQQAYQQGQQTFGADEARLLEAAKQRGTLGASLAEQSRLGQGMGLEGLKAYQQADQFGRTMGLDTAKYMGTLGGQMTEQARAQQGMSLDAAKALGVLGGQQYDIEKGLTDQMAKYGTQQRELQQRYLDQQYEDFLAQRSYGKEQLNFLNSLLHGQNLGSTQIRQDPRASMAAQLAGAGVTGLAAYNAMK